jgi:hypothetical protein
MKIANNKVLILPKGHYTSDGVFELYDSFNPERHWSVSGQVVMLPDRLVCNHGYIEELRKNRNPISQKIIQEAVRTSLDFETYNQLEIGDMVWFRYNNHANVLDDGEYIEYKNVKLLLIDYDTLYLALRKENQIPLNGWIFVEPIDYSKDELVALGGGFEKWVKDERVPGVGIVRLTGEPNSCYIDGKPEGQDIPVGKKILFRRTLNVPIEWAYHKELNEGKYPYYRMQRKDVLAIID